MTPDIRRVREIAHRTGCGLPEAKRIAIRLEMIERAEKATSIEQLRAVVKDLIIEVLQ